MLEVHEIHATGEDKRNKEVADFGDLCARIAIGNVGKWLDKAFTEYLAAPRETGKALPLMKWLRLELAKMASGEREIPGPNG
jgi:hypothetical protein